MAEQGNDLDSDPAKVDLLPLEAAVAEMERVKFGADEVRRLRQGQFIPVETKGEGEVAIFDEMENLVGTGVREHGQVRPRTILTT
jgi:hypothetical protein